MYYLGLNSEEEYADVDTHDLPHGVSAPDSELMPVGAGAVDSGVFEYSNYEEEVADISPLPTASSQPHLQEVTSSFAPMSATSPTVRPVPPGAKTKVQILTPLAFQEVKEIGEYLKANQPIIINLQDTQKEISRRIVDFASGVCFALGGQMERVAELVYLLAPADVEIDPEDKKRFA